MKNLLALFALLPLALVAAPVADLKVNPNTGAIVGQSNFWTGNASAMGSALSATFQPLDSDLTAWASKTTPAGNVVGTTDTQTLTGKTLTSPVINSPTGIGQADVGLGNVNNTSDALKPVSAAQQAALDLKANIAAFRWSTKTTTYTAVAGDKILANTHGSGFTITLPAAPSVGDQIDFADARKTWDTNNLTLGRNGLKINGGTTDLVCDVEGDHVTLVYQGTDEGWLVLP